MWLQCTTHDVADKDVQPELAKDSQRLQDLKANLRKGQDIWLELYQQIFVKVRSHMVDLNVIAQSLWVFCLLCSLNQVVAFPCLCATCRKQCFLPSLRL